MNACAHHLLDEKEKIEEKEIAMPRGVADRRRESPRAGGGCHALGGGGAEDGREGSTTKYTKRIRKAETEPTGTERNRGGVSREVNRGRDVLAERDARPLRILAVHDPSGASRSGGRGARGALVTRAEGGRCEKGEEWGDGRSWGKWERGEGGARISLGTKISNFRY
jgi:hypothetical protein